MKCPDCGYILSPFDRTCPRCDDLKRRGPQALIPLKPVPPSPQDTGAVTPLPASPAAFCVHCGTPAHPEASFCGRCGRGLPAPAPPSAPVAEPPGFQMPPAYAAPPPYAPAPVNVSVNVSQNSGGGWWAALLVLLFGTPLGCVAVPVAIVVGLIVLGTAVQFAPLLVAGLVAAVLSRLPLDRTQRPYLIGGTLVLGAVVNVLYWFLVYAPLHHGAALSPP